MRTALTRALAHGPVDETRDIEVQASWNAPEGRWDVTVVNRSDTELSDVRVAAGPCPTEGHGWNASVAIGPDFEPYDDSLPPGMTPNEPWMLRVSPAHDNTKAPQAHVLHLSFRPVVGRVTRTFALTS